MPKNYSLIFFMKTKTLISIFILSLIFTIEPIFAQTVTSTPKTVRNQVRQETREEKQEAKEEKKATISALKLKRSEAIYKAIKMGLTKRYAVLLKIKAKLEARITKNPMKKNTSTAVTKLKEFKAVETSYTANLAAFDAKFTSIISSSTTTKVSQLVAELKATADTVRTDLNNMKKILKEAIVLLAQSPKLEVTKTE